MNLKDLVERVYAITDRNPNTAAYKAQIVNWLNDTYLGLCSAEKWLFMQSRTTTTVYPDYTTGTVSVTSGSRLVDNFKTATWGAHMDGHLFIGPDGRTYTIARTVLADQLYLTSNYLGTTAALQSYTIRFFAYPMPLDCVEPSTQVSREDDYGRIQYIDNETEASAFLDRDDTGDPQVYMSAGHYMPRHIDGDMTLAAGIAPAGSLVSGTTYYYRLCTYSEGVIGPPTAEVSFTATATGKIVISNIQNFTSVPGVNKYLFRRTGTSKVYYYLTEIPHSTTSYTDDGSVAENLEMPLKEYGQVLKVWFWPRPDAQKDIELWYMRRPRRLQNDNDAPDLPQEYHSMLAKMGAIEVLKKYNQPISTLQAEVREQMTMLRRRYLSRSDRQWRMGNSWEPNFRGSARNLGTATLT